jgi:hypothetical protein
VQTLDSPTKSNTFLNFPGGGDSSGSHIISSGSMLANSVNSVSSKLLIMLNWYTGEPPHPPAALHPSKPVPNACWLSIVFTKRGMWSLQLHW